MARGRGGVQGTRSEPAADRLVRGAGWTAWWRRGLAAGLGSQPGLCSMVARPPSDPGPERKSARRQVPGVLLAWSLGVGVMMRTPVSDRPPL